MIIQIMVIKIHDNDDYGMVEDDNDIDGDNAAAAADGVRTEFLRNEYL